MKESMKPFVKYPGGKTKEIPVVLEYMPKNCSRYFEPFVGGGSIYFALNIKESFINDKSDDLYQLYIFIKNQDSRLKEYLESIDKAWKDLEHNDFSSRISSYQFVNTTTFDKYYQSSSKRKKATITRLEEKGKSISESDRQKMEITARKTALYMIIRDIYNKNKSDKQLRSASFYFLREYCYSSMFRFSSKGDFNVPYGGMSYNLKYMDTKIKYMFSKEMKDYMKNTVVDNEDFEVFLNKYTLSDTDFIFLDPPYDTDFSTYDNNPFDKNEQIRLRDYLKNIKARWMLIIKKTDFIYELYKGFTIKEYDMNYMVSFKNRNERETRHLIILNY